MAFGGEINVKIINEVSGLLVAAASHVIGHWSWCVSVILVVICGLKS